MLNLSSWLLTLPIMVAGMAGTMLVISVIVLSVMVLNRLTGSESSNIRST